MTAYLAGLALVGFWPTPVDRPILGTLSAALKYLHGLGVPGWVNYHLVEYSANVAMFIPLGILAAIALPTKSWWSLAVMGMMASLFVELGQLMFTPTRFTSLGDIVTNTCGAAIGITSARVVARISATKLQKA
ncbi:VanZ family protein [Arthrobacter sp. TS-15]|uniref:VanZ family protein n=1 Tax=Arthrobacter sp. TS-15 TaxID=2510797 RepID=UPI0013587A82|nr:VanZ family protein [Arthrobacter sp. TS-15]